MVDMVIIFFNLCIIVIFQIFNSGDCQFYSSFDANVERNLGNYLCQIIPWQDSGRSEETFGRNVQERTVRTCPRRVRTRRKSFFYYFTNLLIYYFTILLFFIPIVLIIYFCSKYKFNSAYFHHFFYYYYYQRYHYY